jgi:2'-5' RNA ligase
LRLFVAVVPPDDVVADLLALRRKDQRGVRFVKPEAWHVTLRFLGECPAAEVVDALVDAQLPAARARLGAGVDVLDERVLAIPVDGLDDLAAAVVTATRDIGDPPPRRRFRGHLTVARTKPGATMPPALGSRVAGEWDVDSVELVRSRLHPDGARYEVLESFPLDR